MLRSKSASICLALSLVFAVLMAQHPATQGGQAGAVTLFEGARLIVGDGSAPIDNAAFVVQKDRFVQVGRRGELKPPAGAARVDLSGKTVMPAIVDTHAHLANERAALIDQLQHKAYYGVAAVTSLGQDAGDLPFQI